MDALRPQARQPRAGWRSELRRLAKKSPLPYQSVTGKNAIHHCAARSVEWSQRVSGPPLRKTAICLGKRERLSQPKSGILVRIPETQRLKTREKPRICGLSGAFVPARNRETGLVGWRASADRTSLRPPFPANREFYREFRRVPTALSRHSRSRFPAVHRHFLANSLGSSNREIFTANRD